MTDNSTDTHIAQLQQQLKGLNIQLQAHQQLVNENLQMNLQLKTNLIAYQQAHQEVVNENQKLNSQVKTLTDKMLELSPPKQDEIVRPD